MSQNRKIRNWGNTHRLNCSLSGYAADFISDIQQDTGQPIAKIAKDIIDSFVDHVERFGYQLPRKPRNMLDEFFLLQGIDTTISDRG